MKNSINKKQIVTKQINKGKNLRENPITKDKSQDFKNWFNANKNNPSFKYFIKTLNSFKGKDFTATEINIKKAWDTKLFFLKLNQDENPALKNFSSNQYTKDIEISPKKVKEIFCNKNIVKIKSPHNDSILLTIVKLFENNQINTKDFLDLWKHLTRLGSEPFDHNYFGENPFNYLLKIKKPIAVEMTKRLCTLEYNKSHSLLKSIFKENRFPYPDKTADFIETMELVYKLDSIVKLILPIR